MALHRPDPQVTPDKTDSLAQTVPAELSSCRPIAVGQDFTPEALARLHCRNAAKQRFARFEKTLAPVTDLRSEGSDR